MMVLDTNVISELFKPRPLTKVMDWVENLPGEVLFTTAITRGELLFGLHCMPAGRRRNDLLKGLERLFSLRLVGHVLPYDDTAAQAHAVIAAQRRKRGQASSQSDAMIAGIVASRGVTLATRNLRDFTDCGIDLVDPWH